LDEPNRSPLLTREAGLAAHGAACALWRRWRGPAVTASAKIDAEKEIMGHIATAGPAIERRLAQWLTAHDGLLFLREPPDAIIYGDKPRK